MANTRKMWEQVLQAGSNPDSNASIGTRFGLMFDPLHYITSAFGFQDNYDRFVNKSGDFFNKQGSSIAKPIDKVARQYDPLHKAITSTPEGDVAARWITNKPASAAGLVYGGIEGAGALYGGAGGGGAQGSNLGVFANGGQGGMAGVGGGNAGALAASGKIAGGAGAYGGATGEFAMKYGTQLNSLMPQGGGATGGMFGSSAPAQAAEEAQQQEQRSPLNQSTKRLGAFGRRPYSYRGSIVWI